MGTPDKIDVNSPDRTDLKPVDHERFFEAMDFPPLPTEALRAAFRRRQETPPEADVDKSN